MQLLNDDVKVQAMKAGPAILGTAYSLTDLTWSNIAAALTAAYVLVQMFFLIRDKWWRDPQRIWPPRRCKK